MKLGRRDFIKITGASLAASTLHAIGFGGDGEALAASVRPFKLTATTETRNTCTYCSVACGILIYSMGDRAKNRKNVPLATAHSTTMPLSTRRMKNTPLTMKAAMNAAQIATSQPRKPSAPALLPIVPEPTGLIPVAATSLLLVRRRARR